MSRVLFILLTAALLCATALTTATKAKEIVDPAEAQADPDFAIQGEYVGEGIMPDGSRSKAGAQVIAQGGGKFQVVVYQGGLPGDGWRRDDKRFSLEGQREGDVTNLSGSDMAGKIADGVLTITDAAGKEKVTLKRIERKSPTLGAKPPQGAIVIFDGSGLDMFEHVEGHLTADNFLLSGVTTKPVPDDHTLHLEFRLSWMPEARGQGRSNSGVYLHDCYECQVLDSFGLEGRNNECGGFYSIREPDVNMCLPPLQWQTFDFELIAPKYEDGKKVSNAKIEVKHNGVVIHPMMEFDRGTPGRKGEGPGPRGIHLQGHGNKVYYRNVWVLPKK